MSLAALPTELVLRIATFADGHEDIATILPLLSTCRQLCHTLWPLYTSLRLPFYEQQSRMFQELLKGPNDLISLNVDEDENMDMDSEESDSEYDSGDTHSEKSAPDQPPASSFPDPHFIEYSSVLIYLGRTTKQSDHRLLRSFVRRVPRIDSLILDLERVAHIQELVPMIHAAAHIPDLELIIRGEFILGHQDWQSGPFNPPPGVLHHVKSLGDDAYTLRRLPSLNLPLPSFPRMSDLVIETDVMFAASMYPIILQLMTKAPLTSLTLRKLYLDAFNWSHILPEITIPQLDELTINDIEVISEDLILFLRRHPNLTTLDLSHTKANAMTLRLLINFDLPQLETLRADPSYLISLLQYHTMGRFQALRTVGVTFPVRMSKILLSLPKVIPLELEDLTFRDLDDFYTVYSSLMRCTGATTIELENIRYNGFVEWVISTSGTFKPFRSVQEVVIIDGDLLIRRGTVLPLTRWMSKNCPSWTVGRVSKFSLPTDPAVDEMVRRFFTVVFPAMVSLQYKTVHSAPGLAS